jgi:hypothetical protein
MELLAVTIGYTRQECLWFQNQQRIVLDGNVDTWLLEESPLTVSCQRQPNSKAKKATHAHETPRQAQVLNID